nr:ribonuclease H-like domain-containing protein [Tanacetum cinerariifolium]
MRIEQYFLMTDYSLWEVIINGDSPIPSVVVEGAAAPAVILTTEQKLARRNELKARGTFLMALPDKYQLKFNSHKDAKTLMQAIEKRFGGNTETKKVQKTLLKQQFENFTGSSSEDLDQIHDRLQKLVSQLEIHRVSLSQEDVNLKFLRSLPSEWKTHTLIWRNKANLEEHSLDDFAATSVFAVCEKLPVSSHLNIDSLSNAVIFSFFSNQSTSPQIDNEDLKQIDVDDLEEMDLRWQMAMLTMRARRFLQKTGRNLEDNRATTMDFDMSKVECYNCYRKGHFARECRSPKDIRRTVVTELQRRHVPVETSTSNALVSQCDGIESYDYSYQAEEEPANFALMAISSTSSSDNEDNIVVLKNEVTAREDESEANDSQSAPSFVQPFEHVKLSGYSVQPVKAPILDDTPKPTSSKTNGSRKKKNRKTCFVCRGVDYLIKDCNFHTKPKSQPTPRNSAYRGYDKQYASSTKKYPQKHRVPTAVFTKSKPVSVTAARPVSAAIPKIMATKPRHTRSLHTNPNSIIKRHKTRSKFSKTCNSSPKVTAANAKIVSAAKGKKGKWCNPQHTLKDKGVIDSGCSRHMTGNMSNLSNFQELNGDFKLPDENQVLLRVPRENNMYNVNLKDIVPSGDLTCLFAKATIDESNLWHRRLGHVNFKTINKLVKGNLVKGLPTKNFENQNTCVACMKGKKHRASCKSKPVSSVYQPLFRLVSLVTILNTLDSLDKFDGKVDEGFLVGYSISSKAFRVFNSKTRIVQETLHVNFLENKPNVAGGGPIWLFDSDTLTKTMNYQPVTVGNQSNPGAGFQDKFDVEKAGEEIDQQYVLFPIWSSGSTNPQNTYGDAAFDEKEPEFDEKKPESEVNVSPISSSQSKKHDDNTKREAKGKSHVESFTRYKNLIVEFEDFSDNIINEVNTAGTLVPTVGQIFPNNTYTFSTVGLSNVVASLLPIPFWVEAVNTACYVQNRILVTKPQNKTPYELLHGRAPSIGFMRPFGCHVTILNTLDFLDKFKEKVDEGFLVGYSMNSKAFRVFNSQTLVKENKEKDKIGTKPNKNRKRDEAGKSQKKLQSREQEKIKKMQVEGPKM